MIYNRHFDERISVTSTKNTLGRLTAHAYILICQCVDVVHWTCCDAIHYNMEVGEGQLNLSQEDSHRRETNFIACTPNRMRQHLRAGRVSLWQSTATPAQQAWKRHIVQISHLRGGEGDSGSFQRMVQPRNDRKWGNYYNFWLLSRVHLKLLSMPTWLSEAGTD